MADIQDFAAPIEDFKVGFIGVGNMGSAMLKAVINSNLINPKSIFITSRNPHNLIEYAKLGVQISSNNNECVQSSNIVFICVKPKDLQGVLTEIESSVDGKAIISPIAGKVYADFYKLVSPATRVLTMLPNTPLEVGKGVIGYTKSESTLLYAEMAFFEQLFNSSATLIETDSASLGKLSAISGSGPAFVAMFADALMISAEKAGFSRDAASQMVLQTITGTAELIARSGKPPAQIAHEVCSPGGTTIEGVQSLVSDNFNTVIDRAITATINKWYA